MKCDLYFNIFPHRNNYAHRHVYFKRGFFCSNLNLQYTSNSNWYILDFPHMDTELPPKYRQNRWRVKMFNLSGFQVIQEKDIIFQKTMGLWRHRPKRCALYASDERRPPWSSTVSRVRHCTCALGRCYFAYLSLFVVDLPFPYVICYPFAIHLLSIFCCRWHQNLVLSHLSLFHC